MFIPSMVLMLINSNKNILEHGCFSLDASSGTGRKKCRVGIVGLGVSVSERVKVKVRFRVTRF